MLALSMLLPAGCVQQAPLPDVGACATYPEGAYDYGEIGIGTCLSGPTAVEWVRDPFDPGRLTLLVANANPFLDYTGGSVVALDISAVPLDGGRTTVDKIARSALDMPSFPGYMVQVPDRQLALVTNRLTEDSRTRVGFDDLYFVDLQDPDALAFAPAGPDGADHLQLMSDPDPIAYDSDSGLAFVANLTSHTVSVVDALADPIDVVDVSAKASISPARAFDVDGSGSQAEASTLEIFDAETAIDQTWSMSFAEGTYRLWVPEQDGVVRAQSSGSGDWRSSPLDYELSASDVPELLGGVADPQPYPQAEPVFLTYADPSNGSLHIADTGEFLGQWAYRSEAVLQGRSNSWDVLLGGPMGVVQDGLHYLFYDGVDSAGQGGIGLAVSSQSLVFSREQSEPIVDIGNGVHDSERAADPHVLWDSQLQRWRMYYSAWDGSRWTIGQAVSADLVAWEASDAPVFELDQGDVAAPVVVYGNGVFRMWSSRLQDGEWTVGLATSADGTRWTDQGLALPMANVAEGEGPPGVGLQARLSRHWGLSGDTLGPQQATISSGETLVAGNFGFEVKLSSGALLSPDDAPRVAANGVQVDSWIPDLGLVYATVTDADGVQRIAVADWNDGAPRLRDTPVLEGSAGDFDAAGVSDAVVFAAGSGYRMLYAGSDGERRDIGLASSSDGVNWTTDHSVNFARGEDWDSLSVTPGSVSVEADGSLALWYTGDADGGRTYIGKALSTDGGDSWTRVEGVEDPWMFRGGSPGEFDASAVRQPFVTNDGTTEHLWYAGSDGTSWQVGYASRALGADAWIRPTDEDGQARPVISPYASNFDAQHAFRPVVQLLDDGSYAALYSGRDGPVSRAGLAVGLSPDALFRAPSVPTPGDVVTFNTWSGDLDDREAILLENRIDAFVTSGLGISMMHLDTDRGFLYLGSKMSAYVYVLDVRDDSTDTWRDANAFDLEAVLVANTDIGAIGFRGMVAPPGSPYLYALNKQPESVMVFDLDTVQDSDRAEVYLESTVGYLPTPRAGETDKGFDTLSSLGPVQLIAQDELLYVSNFNDNSIGVYDLRLGVFGAEIARVDLVGENPHAISLSPDGRLLAVANYVGEVLDKQSSSTITLIDVDPTSPTWLEVVARIVNK